MVTVIHLHPVMTSLMIQWQSLVVVTKLYILKSLKYLVWSFTEKICPTSAHTADHISNNWESAKSAIFSLSCYCFTCS